MDVCFVSQAFVRHTDDPVGSFVFRLGEEMAVQGMGVTAVVPHAAGLAMEETIGHTHVVRFRYAPDRYERIAYRGSMHDLVRGNLLNKALLVFFLLTSIIKTIATVRSRKCDLIHAHWWFPSGLVGAIASALSGVPLMITCHGTDVGLLGRNKLVDAVARKVFAQAAAVTVVSSYLEQTLTTHLPMLKGRVARTPMPVDRVFTTTATQTHTRDAGPYTILAVGRLSKQKGFHDLIAAASVLRQHGLDVNLLFAGDGEEHQSLEQVASAMHIRDRVRFLASQTPAELAALYRRSDAVVLPSRDEGLGLALIEAMFCGAPVVGACSGGISDIITNGKTGLLVAPGDAQGLADALERVLRDRDLADRLAAAGRDKVRRIFSPDACVRRVQVAYESAVCAAAVTNTRA